MSTGSRYRHLHSHLMLILSCVLSAGLVTAEDLEPSTDYRPEEVVSIIIDALRGNDPANHDKGIATVFRFASPQNRQQTGPLPRFTSMLKAGYADMLNHLVDRRDPIKIDDGVAVQSVWLINRGGSETGYMFRLSSLACG